MTPNITTKVYAGRGQSGKAVRCLPVVGDMGGNDTGRSRLCAARRGLVTLFFHFSIQYCRANMDVTTSKFGNITLKTSTPKWDAGDEDVAVLSSFLPEYLMSPAAVSRNKAFGCSLGRDCRLGDPRATPPGRTSLSGSGTTLDVVLPAFSRLPRSSDTPLKKPFSVDSVEKKKLSLTSFFIQKKV